VFNPLTLEGSVAMRIVHVYRGQNAGSFQIVSQNSDQVATLSTDQQIYDEDAQRIYNILEGHLPSGTFDKLQKLMAKTPAAAPASETGRSPEQYEIWVGDKPLYTKLTREDCRKMYRKHLDLCVMFDSSAKDLKIYVLSYGEHNQRLEVMPELLMETLP
jgi:hypothetical protein